MKPQSSAIYEQTTHTHTPHHTPAHTHTHTHTLILTQTNTHTHTPPPPHPCTVHTQARTKGKWSFVEGNRRFVKILATLLCYLFFFPSHRPHMFFTFHGFYLRPICRVRVCRSSLRHDSCSWLSSAPRTGLIDLKLGSHFFCFRKFFLRQNVPSLSLFFCTFSGPDKKASRWPRHEIPCWKLGPARRCNQIFNMRPCRLSIQLFKTSKSTFYITNSSDVFRHYWKTLKLHSVKFV